MFNSLPMFNQSRIDRDELHGIAVLLIGTPNPDARSRRQQSVTRVRAVFDLDQGSPCVPSRDTKGQKKALYFCLAVRAAVRTNALRSRAVRSNWRAMLPQTKSQSA